MLVVTARKAAAAVTTSNTTEAKVQDKESLLVVQIPVDIKDLPQAFYSSGRNLREGWTGTRGKKPVFG